MQHSVAEMEAALSGLRKELRDHQRGVLETHRVMFGMGKNMSAQSDELTAAVAELGVKINTLTSMVYTLVNAPAPDGAAQEDAALALKASEDKVDAAIAALIRKG